MASRAPLKHLATRQDASTMHRIRDDIGREVVTKPDAVLR